MRQRLGEADLREISERAFEEYGETLETLTTFRCLGRVLTAVDYDWISVLGNLGNTRLSWGRLSRIFSLEGEDLKVLGYFYKAAMQAVFMFGSETWVLNPRMDQALDSFQHRFTRRLTRRQPRIRGAGVGPTHHWRR